MRYPATEKLEIIRLVAESYLPARQTLDKLGIPRPIFYRWFDRFLPHGAEAVGRPDLGAVTGVEPRSQRCSTIRAD